MDGGCGFWSVGALGAFFSCRIKTPKPVTVVLPVCACGTSHHQIWIICDATYFWTFPCFQSVYYPLSFFLKPSDENMATQTSHWNQKRNMSLFACTPFKEKKSKNENYLLLQSECNIILWEKKNEKRIVHRHGFTPRPPPLPAASSQTPFELIGRHSTAGFFAGFRVSEIGTQLEPALSVATYQLFTFTCVEFY